MEEKNKVEQLKQLLVLIEATYMLLTEGQFAGKSAKTLATVQQWLEGYHKDVKYQIPIDLIPAPKAAEAEVVKP